MTERFLFSERERRIFGFFFYMIGLLFLLHRWYGHAMLSQLEAPVLVYPSANFTYWLLLALGIPQLLTGSFIASMVFDVMLLFSAVFCTINCNRRHYALVFCVFIWLYHFTFNVYTAHHYHGLIGMAFMSIPFVAGKPKTFSVLMEGVRYYFMFLFGSAALWKIFRGAVFHSGHLKATLMAQHADFLSLHPDSFRGEIVRYLINHQAASDILFVVVVLLQLSFLTGFFTKKLDWVLFAFALTFHLSNWLVMRIFSIELLALNLALMNWPAMFPKLKFLFREKLPKTATVT